MYGFEAINVNNGWAISVVGITIVFTGLVMLSLVIAQLYKVLAFWENPSKIKTIFKKKQPEISREKKLPPLPVLTERQKEAIKQFSLLVRTMTDHFSLPRLLHLAQISDLTDPCLNLNHLLKIKIIVPDGSGFFTWDQDVFDKTIS